MSITSVSEDFSGRNGTLNRMYQRTYTRVFDVETSDPYVGPVAIRLDSRIPQVGAFYHNGVSTFDPRYEFDHGSFVNTVNVEDTGDGGGISWKVTVEYGPYDSTEFGADPTLWKIRVTFGGERTERVVDFDRDGNPIMNSAGDRFGEPVTVDDHITTMVITRNELVSAFDLNLASLYSDSINNATWNSLSARHCKMGIISTSEEQYDSNAQVWYYKVTYPVQLSRKPWRKDLLDNGYNELTGGYGSVPTPIMNNGQPVSEPVALDGAGHRLAGYSSPVTLPFEVFDETDWSGLNINLTLRLGV